MREATMLLEFLIGGAVALGLLAYLVYALLHPERF
jgi:K+-transporting ATPase KdpF subunit